LKANSYLINRALVLLAVILIASSTTTADSSKIKDLERKLEIAIDTARVNTLLDLSVLCLRQNSQQADSIAEVALNESVKIGFLKERIKSMIYLGNIKSFQGNYELGNHYTRVISKEEVLGIIDHTTIVLATIRALFTFFK